MTNLLTWRFWFALRPESLLSSSLKIFTGAVLLFLIAAVVMFFAKRKSSLYRGFFKQSYAFFTGNFIIGALLLFFDYEMVPFFSARFWLGLWGLAMIVWIIFILKKLKNIPAQKKQRELEKEMKKYLP